MAVTAAGIDLNGAGPQHKSRKDDDPKTVNRDEIEAALKVISSNCSYEVWLKVAAALHDALGESGFELFDRWSATATGKAEDGTPTYTPEKSRDRWRGASTMTDISTSTIFYFADQADSGWRDRFDRERSSFSGAGAGASVGPAPGLRGVPVPARSNKASGRSFARRLTYG